MRMRVGVLAGENLETFTLNICQFNGKKCVYCERIELIQDRPVNRNYGEK